MEKKQYERPIIKPLNTGLMNKFGTRTEYTPMTHIDGVAVEDLIEEFGSPLYVRSEEHTSELQSHSFISYAVFCLKKKT